MVGGVPVLTMLTGAVKDRSEPLQPDPTARKERGEQGGSPVVPSPEKDKTAAGDTGASRRGRSGGSRDSGMERRGAARLVDADGEDGEALRFPEW